MQVLKAMDTLKKPAQKKETINFKVVPSEAKEIRQKAEKFCKGNVTALARIAIAKFNPRPSELKKVKSK